MLKTEPRASDPYSLSRFLDAQASTYEHVRSELAAGQKRSHWMWFIFPQVQGLGSSAMAQRFAISDLGEAIAYLSHPVLGPRLRDCTALVNAVQDHSIGDILGYPDDLKFHSSVTLFARAGSHAGSLLSLENQVFSDALVRFFNGRPDQATLDRVHV